MTQKTAIITGAAQGVGEAIAERLATEGVTRMLLIDRNGAAMTDLAARLKGRGVVADVLTLDLADIDGLMRDLPAALDGIGPVDILANTAGSTLRGGLADTTPEIFDLLFAINVRAPFFLMQLVAPKMREGGVMINVTSMLAYGGPPFLMTYSATKAALVAMTKSAANTLKRDRVRVLGINLGWTWTPGEQEIQTKVHGLPDNWRETVGASQPFGRLLMPEDPAALVAFLASKDACMMTGAIIDLDQFVAGTVDDNPGA
ncbi:oxidoreductase [Sulfitobacter mediterraneus]|uniref:Short-chain dehydrogenase n=1 Tax=Sulfitobacter mediterraneus TaxID=83219 RepID=A0A061SP29_9RHOB|nr:oxidoreductase [Sulfitobacter mediterraneus]KAJ02602.1 short-chain dehydrogenase [Sulfitobacter mediterraneus]